MWGGQGGAAVSLSGLLHGLSQGPPESYRVLQALLCAILQSGYCALNDMRSMSVSISGKH